MQVRFSHRAVELHFGEAAHAHAPDTKKYSLVGKQAHRATHWSSAGVWLREEESVIIATRPCVMWLGKEFAFVFTPLPLLP